MKTLDIAFWNNKGTKTTVIENTGSCTQILKDEGVILVNTLDKNHEKLSNFDIYISDGNHYFKGTFEELIKQLKK